MSGSKGGAGASAAALVMRLRALIALALLAVTFALLSPEFLTTSNLSILVKHVAINAILAIGMTFVILSGGIDLSVGSIAGLCGVVAGGLLSRGLELPAFDAVIYFHTWFVVVIALGAGMVVGMLNGWLVAYLGVAPFIATLGSLYVARGAALLLTGGATFPNLAGSEELGNTGFTLIGTAGVLGLPVAVWVMALLAVVAIVISGYTPFGRQVYAVGGNERAALLAGVRVRRVKLLVYVISGLCSAVVGIIIAAQLGAAHPATGQTFELNAIAAVVLGGTSLMGGRGTITGTLIGAFVIGVLADGLVLLGVSEFWQMVVKGLVIVLAVVLDQFQRRSS